MEPLLPELSFRYCYDLSYRQNHMGIFHLCADALDTHGGNDSRYCYYARRCCPFCQSGQLRQTAETVLQAEPPEHSSFFS